MMEKLSRFIVSFSQAAAFKAMSVDEAERNIFLVNYVDCAFDDFGGRQTPIYPGLSTVWGSLVRSKAKGYRVGPVYDDVLSWFFLELIVKSMALEQTRLMYHNLPLADVVIKVMKPGIEDVLVADPKFVYVVARIVEFLNPDLSRASASMLEEVDFKKEATNIEAFRGYLEYMGLTRQAMAPIVYLECSTIKVLTMERLYGIKGAVIDEEITEIQANCILNHPFALAQENYSGSALDQLNSELKKIHLLILRICHQCKTLCTLKDVRLLYATRLCIPDAIVTAHQIVADQKTHVEKRSKLLEQRADAMGRADALRSLADALGRWADEYPRNKGLKTKQKRCGRYKGTVQGGRQMCTVRGFRGGLFLIASALSAANCFFLLSKNSANNLALSSIVYFSCSSCVNLTASHDRISSGLEFIKLFSLKQPKYTFTKNVRLVGALYTRNCGCSKGSLEDKILVPKPPQNCATCGDPVDGLYCRSCAFVRKCLNEGCFDQTQTPQYTVNHTIFNTQNEFLNSQNKLMEQMTSICDMVGQIMQKKEEERRIVEDQAAKDRYWKIPICYDKERANILSVKGEKSTRYGESWLESWLEPWTKTPAHGATTTPWVAFSGLAPPPPAEMVSTRCRLTCQLTCQYEVRGGRQRCQSEVECGVNLLLGTCLNCTYGDGKPVTCCGCEGPLRGGFCSFCASRDGNSFDYNPNPNSFNESQNFSDYPPQPRYETNFCELCGNDAHFGYDCPTQVPFNSNPDPCYNQNFDNNFPLTSPSFPQQNLCCENCGGPHATFQCQPMNQDFYKSNPSGFDQFQPPQFPVNYPPQETNKEILQAREDLMEAIQAFLKDYDHIPPNEKCMALLLAEKRFLTIKQAIEEDFGKIKDALTDKQYQQEDIQELMSKLLEDVRNISEELSEYINCPSWNRPIFYDNDDDEYTIIYSKPKAITPDLPIEEPDNSLSMGDEHLSTIPEMESDELIKSSVENLVPIPSEFEGISEDTCDVPVCEDPST
ncbi:ribonuclease H-like domain-containing protein [Tanacetum coccineum]